MTLEKSVSAVNKHIGLIPDDYKNDVDVMGAINQLCISRSQ